MSTPSAKTKPSDSRLKHELNNERSDLLQSLVGNHSWSNSGPKPFHLLLGHLGPDKALGIPERAAADHVQRELEAESVAFLVSARNGVESKSEGYLSKFVAQDNTIDEIDLYQVMRAAGQVETLLGLTAQIKWK